jgi:5'-3' exonuclease
MIVHLVDGTYELFRQHFGRGRAAPDDPFAGTVGVLTDVLGMLGRGATHLGVASDHVIESFRNDLWPGYKTSAGMPPELLAQIPVLEEGLAALGVAVWAMVAWEADDALASAAAVADADHRVAQVRICTPDKDLGQCVRDDRVVQWDRRKDVVLDAAAVTEKFGVPPASIPDYLALVGDTADGFPGLPGFGAKSAAAVLRRYGHLEAIPLDGPWDVPGLRGAGTLQATLREQIELAMLFRRIATCDTDVDVGAVDDWRWSGPTEDFAALCRRLGSRSLPERAARLAAARTGAA